MLKQLWERLSKAVKQFCEWFSEKLTVDQGTLVAMGTMVSGIAFMELIGPWFAAPFFFLGALLLGFPFSKGEEQETKYIQLTPEDYTAEA